MNFISLDAQDINFMKITLPKNVKFSNILTSSMNYFLISGKKHSRQVCFQRVSDFRGEEFEFSPLGLTFFRKSTNLIHDHLFMCRLNLLSFFVVSKKTFLYFVILNIIMYSSGIPPKEHSCHFCYFN